MSCIDLFDVAEQLSQVTLVVASDGLWDLWQYKDVLQYPLGKPPSGIALILTLTPTPDPSPDPNPGHHPGHHPGHPGPQPDPQPDH